MILNCAALQLAGHDTVLLAWKPPVRHGWSVDDLNKVWIDMSVRRLVEDEPW